MKDAVLTIRILLEGDDPTVRWHAEKLMEKVEHDVMGSCGMDGVEVKLQRLQEGKPPMKINFDWEPTT